MHVVHDNLDELASSPFAKTPKCSTPNVKAKARTSSKVACSDETDGCTDEDFDMRPTVVSVDTTAVHLDTNPDQILDIQNLSLQDVQMTFN